MFTHHDDNLSSKQGLPFKDLDLQDLKHNKVWYLMNETMRLGSPKQRLMTVLSKDNSIKQWFSKQTEDILSYRNQISEKMLDFSNEVTIPQEHRRKQETRIQVPKKTNKKALQSKPRYDAHYEEFDTAKICSGVQLPYDY